MLDKSVSHAELKKLRPLAALSSKLRLNTQKQTSVYIRYPVSLPVNNASA
jgi:hypothetical protein